MFLLIMIITTLLILSIMMATRSSSSTTTIIVIILLTTMQVLSKLKRSLKHHKNLLLQKNEEDEKLLDSTIVFAPSEEVIGTAIKSVKKDGIIIIGVAGSIPYFSFAEEKVIKGSVIGSRKDMVDVIGITRDYSLEVIVDTFPLEIAN